LVAGFFTVPIALAAKTAVGVVSSGLLLILVGYADAAWPAAGRWHRFHRRHRGWAARRSSTHSPQRRCADFAGAHRRVLIAARAFAFYLQKLVLPRELMFSTQSADDTHSLGAWLFPAAVIALLLALFALRRRSAQARSWRYRYGILIFPALGFFNVYSCVLRTCRPIPVLGWDAGLRADRGRWARASSVSAR